MATNMIEEFLVGLGFKFEGEEGERFKKQTEVIASTINKVTMAAVAATAALYAMTKASADQNYQMGMTADKLDTSAQSLNRWRHAAEIAGVGGDNIITMMERLKQTAQEAARTGSGPFRAYYELGVDFQALADGGQDVADVMEQIIANAQGMDREMAKGALRELGIDERLLDTPIERLREAMQASDQWGQQTQKLMDLSKQQAESQAELKLRWEGVTNMVAERALPAVIEFFDALSEGLEWLQTTGFPIMDEFVDKLGGWDAVFTTLGVVALPGLIAGLGKVLTLVTGIAGGASGAGTALGLLFRAGMVGAAGYAGWEAGTAINEALPQEVGDAIGEYVAKSLAFVGVKSAQEAVENNEGKGSFPSFWDTLEKNRKAEAERYYKLHPEDRPLTGPDALPQPLTGPDALPRPQPTENAAPPPALPVIDENDDWMNRPADPAPDPNAYTPGEGIPDLINEEDIHKAVPPAEGKGAGSITTIDNRKTVTNTYHGVPLHEVDEIYQRNERMENQYFENETSSPIVR